MTERDVVIIGAGPAGMAAAATLSELGMKPTVIDENRAVGGQIYRQPPTTFTTVKDSVATNDTHRGLQLQKRFAQASDQIELKCNTTVWGIFPSRQIALIDDHRWQLVTAKQLILATGAYEFVSPFPGWTLPGVMTPGGAQSMVKVMKVRPGKRVLVAGSGPFLLVVAAQLHAAGVEVVGVVEAVRRTDLLRHIPGLLSNVGLLWEGKQYLRQLKAAGIPVHWGHVVTRAEGNDQLARVVLSGCDRQWSPDGRPTTTVEVDTLCVGYGFIPRVELAQLCGCQIHYVDELGGWIPQLDHAGRTSISGVWMAGDGAGVAGSLVAELEGECVGLAVAQEQKLGNSVSLATRLESVSRRLRRLRRFRAALDQIYRVRPGLEQLATQDTIVCRCEEISLNEVEMGIRFGGTDIRSLKVMTRLGMGSCQGRVCWPAMARRIASFTGKSIAAVGPRSVRPPTQTLSLSDLCQNSASPTPPALASSQPNEPMP